MNKITEELVRFNCKSNNAPAYSCNKPGDNSGWYVSEEAYLSKCAEVRDLRDRVRELENAMRFGYTVATTKCSIQEGYVLVERKDINAINAALEAPTHD